jgi:type I restriction enzyme R subunit
MNRFLGSERASVQKPIINYVSDKSIEYITPDGEKIFVNLGWKYISPEESLKLRGGKTGFIFKDIFVRKIRDLNSEFITPELTDELIKTLERIPPNIKGNMTVWEYLKGIKTVFVPDEKRERNVKFIDTENIEENVFQVTDEFEFTNGKETVRPDIVFLINGIPIIIVETKSAHKIEGLEDAFDQIKRYHRECPELMAILQVFSITHIIRYYYSPTWNLSRRFLFNWKDEMKGSFEELIKTFFDKEKVVRLLTDFLMFVREDDELKKVILRPHQIRAVDKLINRAIEKEKKRALIWHTQGSGKTYTMIVTAKKIIESSVFEKPTVLMLVDRNELETQLFGNISSVGVENIEVAGSKKHLRKLLKEDKRGLIVSMIHKFERMSENINTRENIFVMVDEAHRTTGGKLGNYLLGALPNATYMGFTGTPIDKTTYGKGTFIVFGKDDLPHGYLDKYSISESIEDKTTVPLHYSLAPNTLRVDKETLEKEFLSLAEASGVSDIEVLNKILERAVTLRNMLKNRERVVKIGKYVSKHYKEYIEPMGYKAFVVGVDREACALYKEELDKYLPAEYSKVVYSPFYNDPPELARYHLSKGEEKRIRKAFKNPDELPKILIVTEKLLTGFDAPILYCMYLDKPMRDHVLLQAIARVNRPYEDEEGRKKPSGFVLDFVGIFDNLEKALAFDSKDIEGVIRDIELLKKRFQDLISQAKEKYLSLIEGKSADKAVEAVLQYFIEEEERQKYYSFFSELSDIYEILSPDAFLRPYIDDFETLLRMYRIVKEAYEPGITVDKNLSKKTAKLVQKYTKTGKIKSSIEIYEIDGDTIKKLEESKSSDMEKIFNLLKSIEKIIEKEASKSPYLVSIGEKAELLAEIFKQRQRTTQQTLSELKILIEEINKARKEESSMDMPAEVFTIYWLLKNEGFEKPERSANQMREVLKKFPHWKRYGQHGREVRSELYAVLSSSKVEDDRIPDIVGKIMRALEADFR